MSAREDSSDRQPPQQGQLCHGHDRLKPRPARSARRVNARHQQDGDGSHGTDPAGPGGLCSEGPQKIARRGGGRRGDRSGEAEQERHPAGQERGAAAVGGIEDRVLASIAGQRRDDLGKRQGAAKGQGSAGQPRQQDHGLAPHVHEHVAGRCENAGTDHAGDDDENGGRQSERTLGPAHRATAGIDRTGRSAQRRESRTSMRSSTW